MTEQNKRLWKKAQKDAKKIVGDTFREVVGSRYTDTDVQEADDLRNRRRALQSELDSLTETGIEAGYLTQTIDDRGLTLVEDADFAAGDVKTRLRVGDPAVAHELKVLSEILYLEYQNDTAGFSPLQFSLSTRTREGLKKFRSLEHV